MTNIFNNNDLFDEDVDKESLEEFIESASENFMEMIIDYDVEAETYRVIQFKSNDTLMILHDEEYNVNDLLLKGNPKSIIISPLVDGMYFTLVIINKYFETETDNFINVNMLTYKFNAEIELFEIYLNIDNDKISSMIRDVVKTLQD